MQLITIENLKKICNYKLDCCKINFSNAYSFQAFNSLDLESNKKMVKNIKNNITILNFIMFSILLKRY